MIIRSIPLPKKRSVISNGHFECPQCKAACDYQLIELIDRQLFFFFIPILGDPLGSYVLCAQCKSQFDPAVLRMQPAESDIAVLKRLRERLDAGCSVQELEESLRGTLDRRTIKQYLQSALGISIRKCSECARTYRSEIEFCAHCKVPLKMST